MADITITAANVQQSTASIDTRGTAAEAINAGQCVYVNSSGLIALADASASATAAVVGVAINTAAAGQKVSYSTKDSLFTIGGTVVARESYVVSATAGGIAPASDLLTGEYISSIGVAISTTEIYLNPYATGANPA